MDNNSTDNNIFNKVKDYIHLQITVKRKVRNISKDIIREKKLIVNPKEKRYLKQNAHKYFDSIYEQYGKKYYKRYVPNKYRKANIKSLIKERRFIPLIDKHGKYTLKKYKRYIKRKDIEYKTGSKLKGWIYTIRNDLLRIISKILLVSTLFQFGLPCLVNSAKKDEIIRLKEKNPEIYELLDDYETRNENYAKKIRDLNLTDLQIIMKLFLDNCTNNYYREPKIDLISNLGLDIYANHFGQCRNFAYDMADKLNRINPEYNARIITCKINNGNFNRVFGLAFSQDNTPNESADKQTSENTFNILFNKSLNIFMGDPNHAMVLMEIPGENNLFIVDPTNMFIGCMVNRKNNCF